MEEPLMTFKLFDEFAKFDGKPTINFLNFSS